MSGWKRQRPHLSSPPPPKRTRQAPTNNKQEKEEDNKPAAEKKSSLVVVTGLAPGCTVLDLKSRFEMFGCVSRLRIDPSLGFGYVTFRSNDSAQAAIAAALDPSSGITVGSQKVLSFRGIRFPRHAISVFLLSNFAAFSLSMELAWNSVENESTLLVLSLMFSSQISCS